MRRKVEGLIPCPYVGRCIHRTEKGGCIALNDANFPGECHFRKETFDGPFVVDALAEHKKRGFEVVNIAER